MQLVLEKKNTLEMNEFTENEISKTKSRIEISTILENVRKPLILKSRLGGKRGHKVQVKTGIVLVMNIHLTTPFVKSMIY